MNPQTILPPVLALVALTALVWLTMMVSRFKVITRDRIDRQALGSRAAVSRALGGDDNAGNNFLNLFELPVLFYALAALSLASQKVTPTLVTLAWVYVGLRALHSLVHCTYNKVAHRFPLWVASSAVLWAAWIVFAIPL